MAVYLGCCLRYELRVQALALYIVSTSCNLDIAPQVSFAVRDLPEGATNPAGACACSSAAPVPYGPVGCKIAVVSLAISTGISDGVVFCDIFRDKEPSLVFIGL